MATAVELEHHFDDLKTQDGPSCAHALGVATTVRDQIERVHRSMYLGEGRAVPVAELRAAKAELARLRSLLRRIEGSSSMP